MRKEKNSKLTKITMNAAIAAIYAVLTMVLAPISYGPLQFRVSEVLCILPFFFPSSVFGLTVGCLIANLMSTAGILDIIFGPVATMLAALCTAYIGKRALKKADGNHEMIGWGFCIAACVMPVIFNAPIIGAVIAYSSTEYIFWKGFAIYGAEVFIGELGVLFILGLPTMRYLIKNQRAMRFFSYSA